MNKGFFIAAILMAANVNGYAQKTDAAPVSLSIRASTTVPQARVADQKGTGNTDEEMFTKADHSSAAQQGQSTDKPARKDEAQDSASDRETASDRREQASADTRKK